MCDFSSQPSTPTSPQLFRCVSSFCHQQYCNPYSHARATRHRACRSGSSDGLCPDPLVGRKSRTEEDWDAAKCSSHNRPRYVTFRHLLSLSEVLTKSTRQRSWHHFDRGSMKTLRDHDHGEAKLPWYDRRYGSRARGGLGDWTRPRVNTVHNLLPGSDQDWSTLRVREVWRWAAP